ncbi:hypothetical protein HU200_013277 [Digitaria exilis]|uniref:Uncharacterized protein n=1 Tax=Digitaria exilis TaxID=1010633 RepID=A0A835FDW6_9POAL|nr:hypothetical protein HU200_013277 [Digitaria exilis]
MWEQRQRHNPAEGEDWFAGENPVYLRWFHRVARTRLRPMGMEYNMEDVQTDEEDDCYINTRWGNQLERRANSSDSQPTPVHSAPGGSSAMARPSSSHRAGKAPASPQASDDDMRGDDSEDSPGESSLMNMTKTQGESSKVRDAVGMTARMFPVVPIACRPSKYLQPTRSEAATVHEKKFSAFGGFALPRHAARRGKILLTRHAPCRTAWCVNLGAPDPDHLARQASVVLRRACRPGWLLVPLTSYTPKNTREGSQAIPNLSFSQCVVSSGKSVKVMLRLRKGRSKLVERRSNRLCLAAEQKREEFEEFVARPLSFSLSLFLSPLRGPTLAQQPRQPAHAAPTPPVTDAWAPPVSSSSYLQPEPNRTSPDPRSICSRVPSSPRKERGHRLPLFKRCRNPPRPPSPNPSRPSPSSTAASPSSIAAAINSSCATARVATCLPPHCPPEPEAPWPVIPRSLAFLRLRKLAVVRKPLLLVARRRRLPILEHNPQNGFAIRGEVWCSVAPDSLNSGEIPAKPRRAPPRLPRMPATPSPYITLAPFITNLATAFVPLDDPRTTSMSVTIEPSQYPVLSVTIEPSKYPVLSVTIEPSQYSSSFSHDSRPHDRTLEAPQSVTIRGRTLGRSRLRSQARGGTYPRATQARGGTYPRATFRHARGFVAKLEGALTLERRFRPFEARQARACGSSSKRRSAWSKCLLAPGALCSGRSPAATWPACGGDRVGSAEPWRQLAFVLARLSQAFRTVTSRATAHCCLAPRSAIMTSSLGTGRSRAAPPRSRDARSLRAKEHCGGSPAITPQSSSPNRVARALFELGHASMARHPSLRRRRLASRRGAPSYGRAPPWPHTRSRRAERTAGGRVRSPRAPSMTTATATHALARCRGNTVPLLRAQSLHRALSPLLSLAHLAISTSPRSLGLLLPRAARAEPSFSERFTFHTPPFPNSSRTKLALYSSSKSPPLLASYPQLSGEKSDFPQVRISGRWSTRTSNPYFEPSPKPTKHPDSFPESYGCSRTPSFPATASNLAEIEPAATAPPPHVAGVLRASSGLPTPLVLFPTSPTSFHRRSPGAVTASSGQGSSPGFLLDENPASESHFELQGSFSDKNPDRGNQQGSFCREELGPRDQPKGALVDGFYDLVPVDREENLEGGRASVDADSPERSSQLAQEGKPRSIT